MSTPSPYRKCKVPDHTNTGAPSKLNYELIKKIGSLLQRGVDVETACMALSIAPKTYYDWIKRGEGKKNGLHAVLCNTVSRSIAESRINHTFTVHKFANGFKGEPQIDKNGNIMVDVDGKVQWAIPPIKPDWRASIAFLERRYSKLWGLKQTLEHTGPGGGPIQNVQIPVTPEEIADLERELAELRKANELTKK